MENVEQVSAEQKKIICPHCKKEILPCTETAVDPELNVKCHKYCCDTMDFLIYSKKKVRLRILKESLIRILLRINNGTVRRFILSGVLGKIVFISLALLAFLLPLILIAFILVLSPIPSKISDSISRFIGFIFGGVVSLVFSYYFGVVYRNVLCELKTKKVLLTIMIIAYVLLRSFLGGIIEGGISCIITVIIPLCLFAEENIVALRARINKFKTKGVPKILGIGGALMSVTGVVTWIWSLGEEEQLGWIGDRGLKFTDSWWGHIRDNDIPVTEVIRESSLAAMIIGTLLFIAGIVLMVVAFNLSCKYSEEDK